MKNDFLKQFVRQISEQQIAKVAEEKRKNGSEKLVEREV